jgi:hypothetical protein
MNKGVEQVTARRHRMMVAIDARSMHDPGAVRR